MNKETTAFGNIEIKKFHHRLNLIFLEDVDINNIQVSSIVSSGEENHKYLMGYKDDDYKIKPLRIILPKTSTYVNNYDSETKWLIFLIKNDDLLKKYNNIWNKVRNSIKKSLTANPSIIKIF